MVAERPYQINRADNVRARLSVEDNQDGRLAICKTSIAEVLDRIHHVTDIGEVNRRTVSIGEDQGFVVVGLVDLVVGVDLVAPTFDIDSPFWAVRVRVGKRRPHVLKTNAVFVECLWNEFRPYGRQ